MERPVVGKVAAFKPVKDREEHYTSFSMGMMDEDEEVYCWPDVRALVLFIHSRGRCDINSLQEADDFLSEHFFDAYEKHDLVPKIPDLEFKIFCDKNKAKSRKAVGKGRGK